MWIAGQRTWLFSYGHLLLDVNQSTPLRPHEEGHKAPTQSDTLDVTRTLPFYTFTDPASTEFLPGMGSAPQAYTVYLNA